MRRGQQHKKYVNGYEIKRYHDLFARLATRYLFLRINPDSFVNALGRRVDPTFDARVRIARVHLEQCLGRAERSDFTDADSLVTVKHLFYDYRGPPPPSIKRPLDTTDVSA